MREKPPLPVIPNLPKREPLSPAERYPDRFKNISEKERTLSEIHHLLSRYIVGIGGSIHSIAMDEWRARRDVPEETNEAFHEIFGLALQFKKELASLIQQRLGLTDEEAERAQEHFSWTHQIPGPLEELRSHYKGKTGERN